MARMTLIGRLGAAPEKKLTKSGKEFLLYKVATTDPYVAPKEGGE
jgi:single-stranded DNA-binding protein